MRAQHHEMVLEMTHASGMQGWYCPQCGRRVLFLVPPNSEMVIVEPGNQEVGHSGSTGGLRIGAIEVTGSPEELDPISEERLRPWIRALEHLDLDW